MYYPSSLGSQTGGYENQALRAKRQPHGYVVGALHATPENMHRHHHWAYAIRPYITGVAGVIWWGVKIFLTFFCGY
ncbi:MAG: hypothetical protein LBM07_03130 [Culturomica sp.]|nr:hypothetical protein [Culturomica sp.]